MNALAIDTIHHFLIGEKYEDTKRPLDFKLLKGRFQKRRQIRPKSKDPERIWSIKDLLNEADAALDALAQSEMDDLPKDSLFAFDRKHWAGLRAIGPYIPSRNVEGSKVSIDKYQTFPDFMLLGLNKTDEKNDDRAKYFFFELCRMEKLPENTRPTGPGVPYEAGWVGSFKNGSGGFRNFVTISEDRTVYPVAVRKYKTREVPARSHSSRKFFYRKVSIPYTVWETCKIVDDVGHFSLSEITTLVMNFYQQIELNWYLRCSDHRGVVNMSITPHEAKHLFKDRQTAKTRTGKRKTIVHWVTAHYRNTKTGQTAVKTHIRGCREFVWNGMDIQILLPGLHQNQITGVNCVLSEDWKTVPWWARPWKDKWIEKERKKYDKEHENDKKIEATNPATGEKFTFVAMESRSDSLKTTADMH